MPKSPSTFARALGSPAIGPTPTTAARIFSNSSLAAATISRVQRSGFRVQNPQVAHSNPSARRFRTLYYVLRTPCYATQTTSRSLLSEPFGPKRRNTVGHHFELIQY